MSAQEKVADFLYGFAHEEDLIAWARGNGVRAVMGAPGLCLISEAVQRATGVGVVTGASTVFANPDCAWSVPLPEALAYTPTRFDHGTWPDLVQR